MPTVIVVGGPAGTGKTTIAELLSKHFNCQFIEGDALHPQANIDKMSQGIALTDDDRWGWLQTLTEEASRSAISSADSHMCVVSCSMLKKLYRDFIKDTAKKVAEGAHTTASFRFVFLHTTYEELLRRVNNRQGHYMKLDMVHSQYEIMQIPEGAELLAEGGDALSVDTTDKTPQDIYNEIVGDLDRSHPQDG